MMHMRVCTSTHKEKARHTVTLTPTFSLGYHMHYFRPWLHKTRTPYQAEIKNSPQVRSVRKHSLCEHSKVVMTEHWESAVFVFKCVVSLSAVICILIECELCCLSCIILNIVCRMDLIDSATALNIKRAQHRHIRIIHSGNRGPQDHQMNIKPLIKAKLWHDTLPWSWAASDNENMFGYDEKHVSG